MLSRKLPNGLDKKLVRDNLLNFFYTYRNQTRVNSNLFKKIEINNFENSDAIYTNLITSDIELLKTAKKRGIYYSRGFFKSKF